MFGPLFEPPSIKYRVNPIDFLVTIGHGPSS
jgi:hypothetical protein